MLRREDFGFGQGRVVIPAGLEPATYRLGICRSILMSYGTTSLIYARIDIYFPAPA